MPFNQKRAPDKNSPDTCSLKIGQGKLRMEYKGRGRAGWRIASLIVVNTEGDSERTRKRISRKSDEYNRRIENRPRKTGIDPRYIEARTERARITVGRYI